MMTGLHTVCDIFCKSCLKLVGWTYVLLLSSLQVFAYNESEKYKEGKFIVEKAYMLQKTTQQSKMDEILDKELMNLAGSEGARTESSAIDELST